MIFPGAMLGMLGGGQLGRMFTLAAHSMGYRVSVLDPDPASPAGAIADVHLRAAYQDREALDQLAETCAAVTTEFENVPAESLRWLGGRCVVRPAGDAVATVQDRVREKRFLRAGGFPLGPHAFIESAHDLARVDAALFPGILKRARFGYDGKGQVVVAGAAELAAAYRELGAEPCVLERRLDLWHELSVVVARGADGRSVSLPVAENRHRNAILEVTIVPAMVPAELAREAERIALGIAERLDYCGVMAVEFFVSAKRELLVNEIAPRPHNSGHFSIDACVTSQFEQQVRTLCELPLGDPRLLSPVAMVNLLGDLWQRGTPAWEVVLRHPEAKLHLYGKLEARTGRKMGHFTVLGASAEAALERALAIQAELSPARAAATV